MNEFEQLLFAADRNISAIREMKEAIKLRALLAGVIIGVIGTLLSIALVWGAWEVIRWL